MSIVVPAVCRHIQRVPAFASDPRSPSPVEQARILVPMHIVPQPKHSMALDLLRSHSHTIVPDPPRPGSARIGGARVTILQVIPI
jgi:hypothetical protein